MTSTVPTPGALSPVSAVQTAGWQRKCLPPLWGVRRLKYLASRPIVNGVGEAGAYDEPDWPRYVRITDIAGPRRLRDDTFKSLPPLLAEQAPLAVGDLLLAAVGATYGKSYLHTRDVGPACFAGYLVRFSSGSNVIPEYAAYWTESSDYWSQVQSNVVQSTIQNFSAGKYRELLMPCPPLEEQIAVTDFLDRETEKIDALVAKKQRLIELLQEKRTALISHAVTKGLDPDVPMKDSGVEWLGQIPQAWNVLPIRRLAARVQTGSTPPTEVEAYYRNGELPWFGPGSFGVTLQLTAPTKWIAASAAEQGAARVFDAGSTFVVCIGATLGKVGLVSAPSSANQQITAITWRAGSIDPLYGALQMKSLEPLLPGIAPASTLPILDQSKIMELPIVVPPLGQQEQIARWLCAQTDAIDALLAKIREATLRLGEYRSSLVTAAVTGQIDVRTYRQEAS